MSQQLKQYELLERIAQEKYALRRIDLERKAAEYRECNEYRQNLQDQIKQYSDELVAKYDSMELNAFVTLELHRRHLNELIDQDIQIENKLRHISGEMECVESDCLKLNVEVKKYSHLLNNLVIAMSAEAEKKESMELDELWLLRGKNE